MDAPAVSSSAKKPGELQAIAILTLVSGILNILSGVAWTLYLLVAGVFTLGISCLCLPVPLFQLVTGILEVMYALQILPEPIRVGRPNTTVAILEIICILGGNVVSVVTGILALVFYGHEDVRQYFENAPKP